MAKQDLIQVRGKVLEALPNAVFRVKLENKCKQTGIELRVVDRFYPSSKLCHNCGNIKKGLKLSDRVYTCECGYTEDRDYNASLNLRDAKVYDIA